MKKRTSLTRSASLQFKQDCWNADRVLTAVKHLKAQGVTGAQLEAAEEALRVAVAKELGRL